MKISIIHPSRSRAVQAINTAMHWVDNMSKEHSYEYILSVDSDDPELHLYHKYFAGFDIVISDNKNLVQATNVAAAKTKGEIIVLVSDDFECYPCWDEDVVKAFEGQTPGKVLKTFDGVQKWIVTLPIMDRSYYERCGWFYCPDMEHLFVDTLMTHAADIQGKLLIRNDLVFVHAHYSTGANKKDAISIKADATWKQGEIAYMNIVRKWIYCNVDIFKVSPEGIPHINWLKARI